MFPTEPAPEKIGAYRILRRLTGSASAVVYLGRLEGPRGFQRTCALKLVPNTAEGDARFAEELAREASICAQLNHPAIVRMFDFFEHEDKLVLVLEHVEGASLDRLLQYLVKRQQKLGDAAIYFIAHRVASALAHAHGTRDEHGALTPVIHRNLHPENVVIGWDGQVRLGGFGLGKILGRTPDTVAGIVKGAPGYMAPEQMRGERVTPKADVYGVGLLLWSLLSGRRPPADGTRPIPLVTLRPDVARPIAALIDTALSTFPEARTTTCQELESVLATSGHAETGREELILRIQSAHATLEVEDAEMTDDRKPTIPVKTVPRTSRGPTARSIKLPAQWPPKELQPEAAGANDAAPRPAGATGGRSAPAETAGQPALDMDDFLEVEPDTEPDSAVAPTGRGWPAMPRAGAPMAEPRIRISDPDLLPPQGGPRPAVPHFGTPPLPPGGVAAFGALPLDPVEPAGMGLSWKDPLATHGEAQLGPAAYPAPRPARRPFSPIVTIVISAALAMLVAATWVFITYRDPSQPAVAASEPPASAAAPAPTPPAPPTPPTSRTPPPATAGTSGAPVGTEIGALPSGFGYLTVTFPTTANVHLNGKPLGVTNRPFQTRCGTWYLRLAQPGDSRYPQWVSLGATVTVACQSSTTVDMEPALKR